MKRLGFEEKGLTSSRPRCNTPEERPNRCRNHGRWDGSNRKAYGSRRSDCSRVLPLSYYCYYYRATTFCFVGEYKERGKEIKVGIASIH